MFSSSIIELVDKSDNGNNNENNGSKQDYSSS